MRAGLVRNVFVVVTAVLALGTLELVASAAGKPVLYGGGQALSVAHWPPNCPTSEVECLLIDIRCVDYDIDSACFNVCTGLCTTACVLGGATGFWGWACGQGCGTICTYSCQFCDEYEYYWYCYCPGDPVPTFVTPRVQSLP